MADSLQPALSYNYGAGNRKRILALERWVLGAAALLSAATMLWMLLGGEQILALFVRTSDPALLAMSIRAMRLFSLSYLFSWAGIALSSFFTALNRPVFSLVMAFCQTLAFPLFCLTLLSSLLGLDGVWLTAAAAGALSTCWRPPAFVRASRSAPLRNPPGSKKEAVRPLFSMLQSSLAASGSSSASPARLARVKAARKGSARAPSARR